MATMPIIDRVILESIDDSEIQIEHILDCDVIGIFGEIRQGLIEHVRNVLEEISRRPHRRQVLGICLTTPGGQAEVVEKLVEIIRHHYPTVYFFVPSIAMSAGTIFCMSGDRIFMDYSSSLGPIDPQVLERDGKYLVPALGYLDKINELIDKSLNGVISPVEFSLLDRQDLAVLRMYEQARDLSVTLLKKWLVQYKFKDWIIHRSTNIGTKVTNEDKAARATEIATLLSDNQHWHAHGRFIGMQTLRDIVRLEIDDLALYEGLTEQIRRYDEMLSSYLNRSGVPYYVYSRHTAH